MSDKKSAADKLRLVLEKAKRDYKTWAQCNDKPGQVAEMMYDNFELTSGFSTHRWGIIHSRKQKEEGLNLTGQVWIDRMFAYDAGYNCSRNLGEFNLVSVQETDSSRGGHFENCYGKNTSVDYGVKVYKISLESKVSHEIEEVKVKIRSSHSGAPINPIWYKLDDISSCDPANT